MKFIKTASMAPTTLVQRLDQRLSGFTPARSHRRIHASSVTSQYKEFCPREYILLDILKKKQKDEYLDTATRVAFDVGDAYADMACNQWLVDYAVGDWQCQMCGNVHPFSKVPGFPCSQCGKKMWKYKEIQILSETTGIGGSFDLLVDLGLPKYIMVELKTIDKDQFKSLDGPLSEHRIRTALYLHLVTDCNHPNRSKIESNWAYVLYMSKGYGNKNPEENKILPFREFKVSRDAAPLLVEEHMKNAQLVHLFRKHGGKVPPGVCKTALCKRSYACPVKKECFSKEFESYTHIKE